MESQAKVRLLPMRSSNIEAVGHTGDVLFVRFKGGSVYRYRGVSETVFHALLGAESKGAFLARHVTRNKDYSFDKLPPETAEALTD